MPSPDRKLDVQTPGANPLPETEAPTLANFFGRAAGDQAEAVKGMSSTDLEALLELAPDGDDNQAARDIIRAEINTRAKPSADGGEFADLSDGDLERLAASVRAEQARRVANLPPPSYEPNLSAKHPYAHIPAAKIDPKSITKAVLSRDGWVMPSAATVV